MSFASLSLVLNVVAKSLPQAGPDVCKTHMDERIADLVWAQRQPAAKETEGWHCLTATGLMCLVCLPLAHLLVPLLYSCHVRHLVMSLELQALLAWTYSWCLHARLVCLEACQVQQRYRETLHLQ